MSILFCSITKKLFFIFLCSYRCFLGNFLFIKKFVVIMKIYAITTFFEISLHYTHIFSLLFIWRRNMGILCDLIVSAKDKNKDSLMEIINKFRPLIKKQAYEHKNMSAKIKRAIRGKNDNKKVSHKK